MVVPQSFKDLLALHPDDLARCDVAVVNLLCATGLRGAENLDIPACLAKLDQWASAIREETVNTFRKFMHKPGNTPGFLCCWTLLKTLRHTWGLKHSLEPEQYDPNQKLLLGGDNNPGPNSTYYNSDAVFIHGVLGESKAGLCSALPVLYAAVGRRLGYPIRLVLTIRHPYIRWDDPNDTFNMEASKYHINRHPPEYYLTFPRPRTEEEQACGGLDRPLTPTEELALFVRFRGGVFYANSLWDEALEMHELAYRLFPQAHGIRHDIRVIENERVQAFMKADGWGYEPDGEVDAADAESRSDAMTLQ